MEKLTGEFLRFQGGADKSGEDAKKCDLELVDGGF